MTEKHPASLTAKLSTAIIIMLLGSFLTFGVYITRSINGIDKSIALVQRDLLYLASEIEGKTDQRWRRSDAELSHLTIDNAVSNNNRRITALEFATKNRNELDIGVPK